MFYRHHYRLISCLLSFIDDITEVITDVLVIFGKFVGNEPFFGGKKFVGNYPQVINSFLIVISFGSVHVLISFDTFLFEVLSKSFNKEIQVLIVT